MRLQLDRSNRDLKTMQQRLQSAERKPPGNPDFSFPRIRVMAGTQSPCRRVVCTQAGQTGWNQGKGFVYQVRGFGLGLSFISIKQSSQYFLNRSLSDNLAKRWRWAPWLPYGEPLCETAPPDGRGAKWAEFTFKGCPSSRWMPPLGRERGLANRAWTGFQLLIALLNTRLERTKWIWEKSMGLDVERFQGQGQAT